MSLSWRCMPCSQSGRFDRLKEVAMEYSFLLKTHGMLRVEPSKP